MNIKQLKSQSLLQEALCEALCELNDARLRSLAITKVELSAGKESAKVFLDENSFDTDSANILSALKKASGAIRANISAQLSWYKVPNLRFEIDRDLAQMNRLDEIFKKIHAKENAESSVDSATQNISSLRDSAKQNRGNPKDLRALRSNQPPIEKTQDLQGGLPRRFCESARNDNFLDSSLRECSAQNDKIKAKNGNFGGKVAESRLDSTNKNNPSLRADSQNLRGKPPCDSVLFLQQGLPHSHSLARNDNCGENAESSQKFNTKKSK